MEVCSYFQKFENKISLNCVARLNNYGKNQCKKKEHNQHTSVLQLSYYFHVKNSLIISLIFIFLSCEKGHDSKEFIRENSKPRRNHESRPAKSNPGS